MRSAKFKKVLYSSYGLIYLVRSEFTSPTVPANAFPRLSRVHNAFALASILTVSSRLPLLFSTRVPFFRHSLRWNETRAALIRAAVLDPSCPNPSHPLTGCPAPLPFPSLGPPMLSVSKPNPHSSASTWSGLVAHLKSWRPGMDLIIRCYTAL